MTFPGVPWFVGGGAENPPEAARLLSHIAAGGDATGVLLPGDCEVLEAEVPSGSIRVAAGAVIVPNTKSNANGEVYVERNPGDHTVTITPTDASGPRSDLVYYRVADPQYSDEPAPASVADGPYSWVEVAAGVSSSCESVADAIAEGVLPAGRVGLALARVDMPASTGTVTQGLIVDVRKLARPRNVRRVQVTTPSAPDTLTSSGFTNWPADASWNVEVPSWATHAVVHITAVQFKYGTANVAGYFRAKLGTVTSASVPYDVEAVSGKERGDFHAVDTLAVPSTMRGTTQTLKLQGQRTSASGGVTSTTSAPMIADIEFQERI